MNAEHREPYLRAKRELLQAAVSFAREPSEGKAYCLRVAAKAFLKARERAELGPISEES